MGKRFAVASFERAFGVKNHGRAGVRQVLGGEVFTAGIQSVNFAAAAGSDFSALPPFL
jgi:hypothetical protein